MGGIWNLHPTKISKIIIEFHRKIEENYFKRRTYEDDASCRMKEWWWGGGSLKLSLPCQVTLGKYKRGTYLEPLSGGSNNGDGDGDGDDDDDEDGAVPHSQSVRFLLDEDSRNSPGPGAL